MFWCQLWRKYSLDARGSWKKVPIHEGTTELFFFFVIVTNQIDMAWGILDCLTLKHLGDIGAKPLNLLFLENAGQEILCILGSSLTLPAPKVFFP